MGLIIAILLGALVGHIAARISGRHEGFIVSTIIGVLGALLGNFVSYLFGGGKIAYLTLSLSGLLWSFLGAIVVVAILNFLQRRKGL